MKRILITGANGYIGNCLFHFLKGRFKIIGIDKEKSPNKQILQCNILNKKKLDLIIKKEKPEIIIHLAAQSLVDETINKKKYYDNNVLATNSLLEIMKKNNIKKIIFSSTASVYKQSSKPLREKSKLKEWPPRNTTNQCAGMNRIAVVGLERNPDTTAKITSSIIGPSITRGGSES